jgi:hypothetical protein
MREQEGVTTVVVYWDDMLSIAVLRVGRYVVGVLCGNERWLRSRGGTACCVVLCVYVCVLGVLEARVRCIDVVWRARCSLWSEVLCVIVLVAPLSRVVCIRVCWLRVVVYALETVPHIIN